MSRSREYNRLQRKKAIKRKKNICTAVYDDHGWYKFDGQYSKGKVHCSCPMCRGKDQRGRHLLTLSEKLAISDMKNDQY